MIFLWIVRALVTLLALTNRILVVCYVKLLEKQFLFFLRHILCLTLEFFFCSVYYYYLTRLISLSIIFFCENIATCTIWGIAGLELPMKVVVSCDKLGVGADIL